MISLSAENNELNSLLISAITTFGEILLHLWLELVICILTSHLFDLIDQRVALVTMALYFKPQTRIVDWDEAVFFCDTNLLNQTF